MCVFHIVFLYDIFTPSLNYDNWYRVSRYVDLGHFSRTGMALFATLTLTPYDYEASRVSPLTTQPRSQIDTQRYHSKARR